MSLAEIVYTKAIASSGISKRFWRAFRRLLIVVQRDPGVTMLVHGKRLRMPLSHALPDYLASFPYYDSLPGRIRAFCGDEAVFTCIDVGANIGDSIAAFHPRQHDRFLAVEPSETYMAYLEENWPSHSIEVCDALCGAEERRGSFSIALNDGTGHVSVDGSNAIRTMRALDAVVQNGFPHFARPTLIKIDTDGFDLDVIEGATKLLSSGDPILLFECDGFESDDYVERAMAAFARLYSFGYRSCLVYDNFGIMMLSVDIENVDVLTDLLRYQENRRKHYYFDMLVLPSVLSEKFRESERKLFSTRGLVRNPNGQSNSSAGKPENSTRL